MTGIIKIEKDKVSPESVKVNAYLNPHPLDSDSTIEAEELLWLPGFDARSIDEDGEHPIFRDHNCQIYESIEKMTEDMFRVAITNIWPLLDCYIISQISISIDYTGLLLGNNSLAAYNYINSRPEYGYYRFDLTRSYLLRQLKTLEEGKNLSLKFITTWEHEIVHLLDHWESVKASMYRDSLESSIIYTYYILKYRSEGIAELYYLLKGGIEDIKSIKDAKHRFKINIDSTKNKLRGTNTIAPKEKESILNTYDFYEIGPWIILDLLISFEGGFHREFILSIISDCENGVMIKNEDILQVIKIALRINNQEYLEGVSTY